MWTLRAPGGQKIDLEEVRRALQLFADPEAGCEIVGPPSWVPHIGPGADIDALAEAVKGFYSRENIYIRLNSVASGATKCAKDNHIIKRRWLFLDIDPVKAEGFDDHPATDAEHENARRVTERIRDYLSEECGWPAPVMIDSGNGWYLAYKLNLPNNRLIKQIIEQFTKGISAKFSCDLGGVDEGIFNAGRLAKLPGTLAKKGDESEGRPYRMCQLVYVPHEVEIVDADMIAEVADRLNPQPFVSKNGTHKKSLFLLKAGTANANNYVRKILDNECARVALAKPGPAEGRNNALNVAAFKLGQLIPNGYLARPEIESRLRDAARACGLYEDKNCGERGVEQTIRSGVEAGVKEPRLITTDRFTPGATPYDPESPKDEEQELLTVGAHEIEPELIDWLWYGRLPRGKLVTWAGQTGLGKSFLSCDIAARLSRGTEIPFEGGQRFPVGGTLMINCEDGYADTIVPRLIEAGADLQRIRFLKTEKMAEWTLAHLNSLEKAIQETPDCRLVVIDPAPSFLGGVDDHKNSEFRSQILLPLSIRVQNWGVSAVMVTHFNKAGSHKVDVLDRVMGGIAWVSGVRVAAAFIKAPTPEEPERRMYVPLKSNICRRQPALAYRLVNVDGDKDRCRVEWIEAIDTTVEQAMAEALQGEARPRKVVAAEWLIEQFNQRREWSSEDLFTAGKHSGISRQAIFEAKKQLDLPSARRMVAHDGSVSYVWWVPENWPHIREPEVADEGEPT